jgi:hypothetical protein
MSLSQITGELFPPCDGHTSYAVGATFPSPNGL